MMSPMFHLAAARFRRRLLGVIALAVAGVMATAVPASAEPTVSVTTPAGDRYSAGQPLPLVIQVTGARATDGTVTVRVDGVETASERFEVAGGATKTLVVVTDTLPWGGSVVVQVDSSDGDLTVRPRLIDDRESELVGVLGSMTDRGLPATARTITGDRPARLYPIPEVVLAEGAGALQVFDAIVGSSVDLDALPDVTLAGLRRWTAGGGHLVLDDAAGTSLRGFTVAGGGDRVGYGFGSITYTDGGLRRGDVDELIPTSIKIRAGEVGMGFDPSMSGRILLNDAGITVPGIGALLGLVGVYIVAVGPLLFLVLRRRQRQPLAWALIPVLSAVTIGLVYIVGRAQRSDVEVAHATVVAHVDGTRIERSEVLIASSNGGFVGVDLSGGFENAGQLFNEFGGGLVRPVERRDGAVGLDLNPGEASRLVVERVTDAGASPESPLVVTTQLGDRSLTGTVTNTGEVALTSVQVAAGNDVVNIDGLGPGASAEFSFGERFAYVPVVNDRLVQRIDQNVFDQFGRVEAGAVNAGALISWIQRFPGSRSTAQVLAVGWTRDVAAPVRTADGAVIDRGRTAFVTIAPVADPSQAEVSFGEARTELQRLWDFEMIDIGPRGFVEAPSELLITLPTDADPGAGFVLEVPDDVSGIELWNGTRWEASSSSVEAGILAIPEESVLGGRIQLRVGYSDFGRSAMPVLRSAQPGEIATEGVG